VHWREWRRDALSAFLPRPRCFPEITKINSSYGIPSACTALDFVTYFKHKVEDNAQEVKLFLGVKVSFGVQDVLRVSKRQLETQPLHSSFP
jgi:hypothetical protein